MSKLTELQAAEIIEWLESMPWWKELPFVQLEAEVERLQEGIEKIHSRCHHPKTAEVPQFLRSIDEICHDLQEQADE